jgi:hypothetical protein
LRYLRPVFGDEEQLGISSLEEQEVAKSELAGGPNKYLRIREVPCE